MSEHKIEPEVDLTLPNQRHLFEIPDDVVYLNCASLAPQMLSVRAAGEAAMSRNAQPWKIQARDWFTQVEELRALFAQIIKADAEGVALIPATSYGLSVAAVNVEAKPHDRILLIAEDFPSTVYTWRAFAKQSGAEIVTAERGKGESWTDAILKRFDERVKVVSVPNVHWTNGALIDLKRIGQRAREVGATFVVDATQSLGAMPTDVEELRPDFLVTAGYKWLLGPFSLGYMYVVGEQSNLTLTPMAIAALKQLLEWDIARITSTLSKVTASIERRADGLGLRVVAAGQRGPHMLGIEAPGESLQHVAARLEEQNIYVGIRGSSMRISPHLYVTESDLDRFFNLLTTAL